MKLISWNVNGLRAIVKKDFFESLQKLDADFVCLQETKLQEEHVTDEAQLVPPGYHHYWSCAERKGYSGVAVFARQKPLKVTTGFGNAKFDSEGRILVLYYPDFVLLNIYFPNGQKDEERLQYKLDFYTYLFAELEELKKAGQRLLICGDYNTAHNEIDLKHPKANSKTSGFLRIERDWLDKIVTLGYADTFRVLYPDTVKYSWWSYRFNARKNNAGWRIDYFFVSDNVIDQGLLQSAFIDNDIFGSDHCPVGIEVDLTL